MQELKAMLEVDEVEEPLEFDTVLCCTSYIMNFLGVRLRLTPSMDTAKGKEVIADVE